MQLWLMSFLGLLMATVFVLQGLSVCFTGHLEFFLVRWLGHSAEAATGQRAPRTNVGTRLSGVIFLVGGLSLGGAILSGTVPGARKFLEVAASTLVANWVSLVGALGSFALGTWITIWPARFIARLNRGFPTLGVTDPKVLRTAKMLGFAFIAFSVCFLIPFIRNLFSN